MHCMTRSVLGVSVVLAGALLSVSAAAPGKLVRGVTKEGAAALTKAAQAADQKSVKARLNLVRGVAGELDKALQKERQVLEERLKAQKGYEEFRKEAENLLGAMRKQKSKDRPKTDLKPLRQFLDKQKPMLATAWKEAALDERNLENTVARILGRFGKVKVKLGELGTASYRVLHDNVAAVPQTEFTLTAPFVEPAGTHTESYGVAIMNGAVGSPENGEAWVYGTSLDAGGGTHRAVVGDFVTVPAGYGKLRITAVMKMSYGFAALGLVGAAGAGGNALLELIGVNNQIQQATVPLGDGVLAVGLWMNSADGEDTYIVSADFAIPAAGGEYMVRAGTDGYFWSGGAFCIASDNADALEVQRISIQALP